MNPGTSILNIPHQISPVTSVPLVTSIPSPPGPSPGPGRFGLAKRCQVVVPTWKSIFIHYNMNIKHSGYCLCCTTAVARWKRVGCIRHAMPNRYCKVCPKNNSNGSKMRVGVTLPWMGCWSIAATVFYFCMERCKWRPFRTKVGIN
jgi:hypothetical protein